MNNREDESDLKEQIVKEEKKKSELNAQNRFDYEKLVQEFTCFIPCCYEEAEESVTFEYNCAHVKNISLILEEEYICQLQFLINFAKLFEYYMEYKIPLTIDNVYYDENYMVCIKERDLYGENEESKEKDFLFYYKTYVAAMLGEQYTVLQLQESGLEILDQNAEVQNYLQAKTKEELVELLRAERDGYKKYYKDNMIQIGKRANKIKNITLIVTPVLMLGLISLLIYYMVILSPYQKTIISANESYVKKQYVECIDSLESIDVDKMDLNTKYILAFSYIKSENLEKDKIDTLTSKLSVNSNVKELEYWIYLGRLDMKSAENIAQSLSDDKLLIYAYMKELNQLESNTSMNGEEKQSRIQELESSIKSLGDKYTPDDNSGETTEEMNDGAN